MIATFLLKGGIPYRDGATSIFICCPYHEDRTPSLGIATDKNTRVPMGTWNCLGCGEKGGWNKLAGKLQLDKLTVQDIKNSTFVIETPLIERQKTVHSFIDDYGSGIGLKWGGERWRGIKGELLQEIGAYRIFDQKSKQIRVLLPVSVNHTIKACIRASLKKEEGSPTYLNSDGSWGKKWGLFPFDYALDMPQPYLCVVEGPRDALRLIQNDIPAVSILGTQNWSEMKRKLLGHCGKRIILMMDGDRAGETARDKIWEDFKEVGTDVKIVNLSKMSERLGFAVDPATIPRDYLAKIKKLA